MRTALFRPSVVPEPAMPQRPPRKMNHLNRDCREAVVAGILCARQFGHDLYVTFNYGRLAYIVREEPWPDHKAQNCYRVTPTGEVVSYPGYPTVDDLFAEHPEQRPGA